MRKGKKIVFLVAFVLLAVWLWYVVGAVREKLLSRFTVEHLYQAVEANDIRAVKYLMSKRPDLAGLKRRNRAPLHEAAEKGYAEIVELLVSAGADVNVEDGSRSKERPLHYGVASGLNEKINEFFHRRPRDIVSGKEFWIPEMSEAAECYIRIVEILLEKGADVNVRANIENTALHYACAGGSKEMVELLLAHGADVNSRDKLGNTPVQYAISAGHREIVKLLVAQHPDLNTVSEKRGWPPLHYAAAQGDNELIELLIKNGARIDVRVKEQGFYEMAFSIAVVAGHKETVGLLISKGAGVNTEDNSEETALIIAAEKGHKEVTELLIAEGADVNARDRSNQSALWHASNRGYMDVVKLLLARDAQIDVASKEGGRTPMLEAAQRGYSEIARLLIARGADVNAVSKGGWMALHFAANKGDMKMLELLVEKGVNLNARLEDGKSALDIAAEQNQREFVDLLRKHVGSGNDDI